MTSSNTYAQAYQKYREELAQAVRWTNPNYTNSAITRERHRLVMQARANLLAAVPAEAQASGQTPEAFVEGLRPTTADQVAVAEFEWRQARTLLDAGKPLAQVVVQSSPARARAIAAYIDTLPEALESKDPEGVAAEVRALVFDRLVQVGDPDAVRVAAAVRASAVPNAWRAFLEGTIEGEASLAEQSAVARIDPEGWAEVNRNASVVADIETDERVKHLDSIIRSGTPKGAI